MGEGVESGRMSDARHPLDAGQARALAMEGAGPVLVRGGPSSGRTALALARVEKSVLQSSFVPERTLVLCAGPLSAACFRRRLVDAVGDVTASVVVSDFAGLCRSLLAAADIPARPVPDMFREGFLLDAIEVVRRRGARAALERSPTFIADEIAQVVKGRALGDRRTYLDVERGGRFRPLDVRDRETLHDVYLEYQKRLDAAGYVDAEDLPIRGMKALDGGAQPGYDLVVIDDGQFLSRASLLLGRALAQPGDRVMLLLDESSRPHPLGFPMREAGLEVAGRSLELVGAKRVDPALTAFVDAMHRAEEDGAPAPIADVDVIERVAVPEFLEQFSAASRIVKQWMAAGMKAASIAVVTRHTRDLAAAAAALRAQGIPATGAEDPERFAVREGVALLDVDDIRGLRFDGVVVVGVNDGTWPDVRSVDVADRFADRRRLRVAASRADVRLAIVHEAGRLSPFIPPLKPPAA